MDADKDVAHRTVATAAEGYWHSEFGEFISRLNDLAHRLEMGQRIDRDPHTTRTMTQGVTMTTFAPHRNTVEAFVDQMHGGADKGALSGILAEDVVLYGPLGDEQVTGREAVLEAMQGVGTVAADLTYKEVLSGETHHAAYFRLQVEDTVVDGMDYILLDEDGKIAEVTIWWRPLPSGVQMQRHLAGLLGMQPWELLTHTE
ncbi:MAG TPA: nuclear transport factor 2 family protein [Mycobacterium sp.]